VKKIGAMTKAKKKRIPGKKNLKGIDTLVR